LKKSCSKADIKTLIPKYRNSSSTYSTVLRELQGLSKGRLHKPVNKCPIRFSKDVWDRWTLTQKGRGLRILHGGVLQLTCCAAERMKAISPSIVKRFHLPLFKCEGYCTSSTCNVQFKLHINEDFHGKVSFQGKMPVKLITICWLRLFVARTQINSLKCAFICLAESRTKCSIHFIVNLIIGYFSITFEPETRKRFNINQTLEGLPF